MKYESVEPIDRITARAILASEDGPEKARALVALAYHDADVIWVQDLCLSLLADADPGVRGAAALCLGHLARIHGKLDLRRVLPALNALENDAQVAGTVSDAMDDIKMFVKEPRAE